MSRINPPNCYSEIKQKSVVIFDYCKNIIENKNSLWYPYIGWDVSLFPQDFLLKEPVFEKLNQKFPIKRAAILRSDPYQNYEWHTDQYRGVCINMLLSFDHVSHCLFGVRKNATNVYFHELKYKPDTFYLFNNQFPHTIINFDNPRYLFSLEFVANADSLLYPEVYKWMKLENLI